MTLELSGANEFIGIKIKTKTNHSTNKFHNKMTRIDKQTNKDLNIISYIFIHMWYATEHTRKLFELCLFILPAIPSKLEVRLFILSLYFLGHILKIHIYYANILRQYKL
jgi:hypothetical protein